MLIQFFKSMALRFRRSARREPSNGTAIEIDNISQGSDVAFVPSFHQSREELAAEVAQIAAKKSDGLDLRTQLTGFLNDFVDLTRENAKQAFTIDQIIMSLEEVAMSVRNVADDAGKILNFLEEFQRFSGGVHESVGEAVKSIDELSVTHKHSMKLTEEIKSIATQSKIVSFNAYLEASRSEGPGKGGFMIVAKRMQGLTAEIFQTSTEITASSKEADEKFGTSESRIRDAGKEFGRMMKDTLQVIEAVRTLGNSVMHHADILSEITRMASDSKLAIQKNSLQWEGSLDRFSKIVGQPDRATSVRWEELGHTESKATEVGPNFAQDVSEKKDAFEEF